MTPTVTAVWWLACVLWSSTFLFIRIGLAEIPPFTLAWIRLAIALIVLAPAAIARGELRALRPADIWRIAGAGFVLLGVNYTLLFWGARFIPSGLAAILQSGTPLLALGLGYLAGHEQVTAMKLFTLILGIIAVSIIFGSEAAASGRSAIEGASAVFAGSACVAAAYVWMKGYGHRVAPLAVTTIQSAAAVAPLACVALAVEGNPAQAHWSLSAWIAIAYLSLAASVLAFLLNYWLLARMAPSAMLMMGIAEVPVAIVLGAVFLQERLPRGTFLGAACVLLAVAGTLLGAWRQDRENAELRPE